MRDTRKTSTGREKWRSITGVTWRGRIPRRSTWCRPLSGWSGYDCVAAQVDGDGRLLPTDAGDVRCCHQHARPFGRVVAGVDDQMSNDPGLIVDQEVIDVADLAIGRGQTVTEHRLATPETTIVRSSC